MKKEKLVLNEEIVKIKDMMKKINEGMYDNDDDVDSASMFKKRRPTDDEIMYDESNRMETFTIDVENQLSNAVEKNLEMAKEDFPTMTVDELLTKSKEMLQLWIDGKLQQSLLDKYYDDNAIGRFADEIVECALYLDSEYLNKIRSK